MLIDTAKLDRSRGALAGLACGDALGTTLEFKPPGSFKLIRDMAGGGPFGLAKGQWTDDTSMALGLAASFLVEGGCNPDDQLLRYIRWRDEGYMSCTGSCFDIGNTVSSALRNFEMTGDAASGSKDAHSSGNGALMRMAPVVIFNWNDIDAARTDALQATVTTHGSEFCTDASDLFAVMLWLAINGHTKDQILDHEFISDWVSTTELRPSLAAIAEGSYKQKHPPEIRGTAFVVESLEAALWALYHHDDFETGALAAANLGDDADTTAAIYGQLAGALYGFESIPVHWRDQISWGQQIVEVSDALYLGLSSQGIEECVCYCESISSAPEMDTLFDLFRTSDSAWLVDNYNSFVDGTPGEDKGIEGLVDLSARMTWFSRGEKFFDGFWDAEVNDGSIPAFFDSASERLRVFLSLVNEGHP